MPSARYTIFCRWVGKTLRPDLSHCGWHELYDHRNDTALYDVDNNGEYANVVNVSDHTTIRHQLDTLLRKEFT